MCIRIYLQTQHCCSMNICIISQITYFDIVGMIFLRAFKFVLEYVFMVAIIRTDSKNHNIWWLMMAEKTIFTHQTMPHLVCKFSGNDIIVDSAMTSHLIVLYMWFSNIPILQIPECTHSISQNAPFRTEMCIFLFWIEHSGIWNWCILGLMN